MKKRMITVYTFIGLLALGVSSLTSCVDDNESASVTAIRDAKAAQLNALAKYHDAQANAEKIKSEAEAALLKAQAELQQVQADKAKATMSIEIEVAKAEAENNLYTQLINLAQAKANLIKEVGKMEDAQKDRAAEIITAMDGLATDINQLNKDLIEKKYDKIEAEYDLKDLEITKANAENEMKADIAVQEALIAAYEKYSTKDKEEAEAAAVAAQNEVTLLMTELNSLNGKKTNLMDEAMSIYSKLSETKFMMHVAAADLEDATPKEVEKKFDFGDGTTDYRDGKQIYAYHPKFKAKKDVKFDEKEYAEYEKMYNEYKAVYDKYMDADIAVIVATHKYNVQLSLAFALEQAAANLVDYAFLIENCNKEINRLNKDLSDVEAVDNKKEMIAYYETQIKAMTSELEIKNNLYAQYEKALQQVFENQAPSIPEIPSGGTEGGETPAE